MKAIIYTDYGSPDVLHLQEVEKPSPKINEVLIRVYATTVNFGDTTARNFRYISPRQFNMPLVLLLPARLSFGFRKPRKQILGNEFAGTIEAVGSAVTRFKVGDPVFGYRGESMGTYAEYVCMPDDGTIALKPAHMTYEEAATVPYGSMFALCLLRNVKIQRGQNVVINGASGGMGSYAVQLAKHYGAEVTGVCSTPRVDYVKALGADHVVDYTKEDFTQCDERYDLIFDVLGKGSISGCKRSLKSNGRLLLASFKMKHLVQMLWTSITRSEKQVSCAIVSPKAADLNEVKELVEAGTIKTIIDRCFPLEQIAEAHRYVEAGHKHGHVVITLAH
jgi:NADPH:quinone reductase-like Zn-dependent oxidoreductase